MAFINYVTQVQFGLGAVSCISGECDRLGIRKPLIITDKGVRAAGLVDKVLSVLDCADDTRIFDETPSNPTEGAVRAAVGMYRSGGHDGIIAIGGGSAIDLSKGTALCATHDGPLSKFAVIEGGMPSITEAVAPVIAVPTTAGTGSEVGRGAILIMEDGRKLGVLSPYLVPKVAVCDPELTYGLPRQLTAATGMDAIAHCIETFLSPLFNPPADGIALDGLRRGWQNIRKATDFPNDGDARLNMMSASMQGAMAFQKGLGCVHSLSHALGGLDPSLHHGTLNAILLPAVIEFNASSDSVRNERKLDRLAEAMGLKEAQSISAGIRDLSAALGLPAGLRELGVEVEMFPEIIEGALADHSHKTNPRIATPEDYGKILTDSL